MTFLRLIMGWPVRNSWCYSLGGTLTLLWVICTSQNPTRYLSKRDPLRYWQGEGKSNQCNMVKSMFPEKGLLSRGKYFVRALSH